MPAELILRADDADSLLALLRGTIAADGNAAMLAALATRINELGARLNETRADIATQGSSIMATLDQLLARVREQSGTVASLRTFVEGLEQQVRDALTGVALPPQAQAKLDEAFAGIDSNTQSIADAIDSDPNTPAPAPMPVPAPAPAEPAPDGGGMADSADR